jgi:hypothetical protein
VIDNGVTIGQVSLNGIYGAVRSPTESIPAGTQH